MGERRHNKNQNIYPVPLDYYTNPITPTVSYTFTSDDEENTSEPSMYKKLIKRGSNIKGIGEIKNKLKTRNGTGEKGVPQIQDDIMKARFKKIRTEYIVGDINELRKTLVDHISGKVASTTIDDYTNKLNTLIYIYGMTDPTPDQIKRVLVTFDKKRMKGWSRYKYFVVIKHLYEAMGYTQKYGPIIDVKFNFQDKKEKEPLSDKDITLMLNACTDSFSRMLLLFMLNTGCRNREVRSVEVSDVIKDGYIKINEGAKYGKARKVPIFDVAFSNELDRFVKERADVVRKAGLNTPYLFFSRLDGGMLGDGYLYQFLRDLAKKAGVERRVWPHLCRITFATKLHSKGMDIEEIMILLGHKKLSTTGEYVKDTPEAIKKRYKDKLPRLFDFKPL